MAGKPSLLRTLPRLYFWGWIALTPLVLLAGLIGYMSFDRKFEYFVEGVRIGILNFGILWTAVFILIAVIKVVLRILNRGQPQAAVTKNSCRKEFLCIYPLGLTVLVASGFVTEFIAHTFTAGGSFLATIAIGFIPMTLAIAIVAFVRTRGRPGR